jgi:hypothetical protein
MAEWDNLSTSFLPESSFEASCWILDMVLVCMSLAGLVISKASESRAEAGILFDAKRRAFPLAP